MLQLWFDYMRFYYRFRFRIIDFFHFYSNSFFANSWFLNYSIIWPYFLRSSSFSSLNRWMLLILYRSLFNRSSYLWNSSSNPFFSSPLFSGVSCFSSNRWLLNLFLLLLLHLILSRSF